MDVFPDGLVIMKVAVFSDVHANELAFRQMIEHATNHAQCDRFLFLGDLLGYGPLPVETLTLFQSILPVTDYVLGNHDELFHRLSQLPVSDITSLMAVFPGLSRRSLETLGRNLQEIKSHDGVFGWYFNELKNGIGQKSKLFDYDLFSVGISHGMWAVRDFYIWPSGREEVINTYHIEPLLALDRSPIISFVGHTHIPWVVQINKSWEDRVDVAINYDKPITLESSFYIINPGSVGNPRDGDPKLSYLVLNTDPTSRSVIFYRVPYGIDTVSHTMISKTYGMDSVRILNEAPIPDSEQISQLNRDEMTRRMTT